MAELHSTYELAIQWTGGKQGVASGPGIPDLAVASPPAFGGPEGHWSPEHFFLGAAAACWMTTFLAIAGNSRLEPVAVSVGGTAFLERGDDRRYTIPRIVLRPRVVVAAEGERERALRIVHKAEEACLIARSMRAEISLEPEVSVAAG
jgi:organic hydroperoxide reductase OsmC/OhrA